MSVQCGSRLGLSQRVSDITGLPAWLGFSFAQPLSSRWTVIYEAPTVCQGPFRNRDSSEHTKDELTTNTISD